jgi:hypothetical protein
VPIRIGLSCGHIAVVSASGQLFLEKNELPFVCNDTARSGGRPEDPVSNTSLACNTAKTSLFGSACNCWRKERFCSTVADR